MARRIVDISTTLKIEGASAGFARAVTIFEE